MKQPKKLESLKQSTFENLKTLTGGEFNTGSRGYGFMLSGVSKAPDFYWLPEGPSGIC